MALFCAAIKRDSVSLLKFPFRSYVLVFSNKILSVCRLKYLYSYFSSHFWFLVIVVQLIFMLSVLFLVVLISLSWGAARGVMVTALDGKIVISHFELQSCN